MQTLLQLNTSLFSSEGQSSRLAADFVAAWREKNPGARITVRDFALNPVPHLTAVGFLSFTIEPELRTPEQQNLVTYSDVLIEEIRQAQVLVLALPMYNFGVPSTLKAYFDHIARIGVTFRFTDDGVVEGLLQGKKAYVIATRGGVLAGTPLDTETSYVRDFLGFLGIRDVEFIYAEGLHLGEPSMEAAVAGAKQRLEQLLA